MASTGAWACLASYSPASKCVAPRSGRTRTHVEVARQFGLTGCREGRPFLAPHPDPRHAIIAPYGLGERIGQIAHDAEYLSASQIRENGG